MSRAAFVIMFTLTLLNVFALLAGAAPLDVYQALFANTLSSSYGIGQVLFKATPFLFLGVAASIAFRSGVLNIGLEGQLITASLCMGIIAPSLPMGLPGTTILILVGAICGALWALLPALLKVRFQAPEVMTTIMLNFVAAFGANLIVRRYAVSESTHTADVPQPFMLSHFLGSELNTSLLLAMLLALASWALLFRTRTGFSLRAIGDNPHAAELYGIDTKKLTVVAFCISGAIAGIAAINWVLGAKGYHEDGFSGGIGTTGLGVALLGRNHPLAVIPAALLFGLFSYGTLAINTLVPKEMIDVLFASMMVLTLLLQAKKQ